MKFDLSDSYSEGNLVDFVTRFDFSSSGCKRNLVLSFKSNSILVFESNVLSLLIDVFLRPCNSKFNSLLSPNVWISTHVPGTCELLFNGMVGFKGQNEISQCDANVLLCSVTSLNQKYCLTKITLKGFDGNAGL